MSRSHRFVIVAAIDASAASDRVVSAALGFARLIAGAELHVVHVLESLPVLGPQVRVAATVPSANELIESGRKLLRRHENAARAALPELRVVTHLCAGTAWREVLQLAASLQADMLMVGTHDYGKVERFLLGSVAETIVKKAACPVIVVRPKDYHFKDVPEIEPPCADCVQTQRETNGEKLWCARHAGHHPHARLHYEYPEAFAVGSSTIHG